MEESADSFLQVDSCFGGMAIYDYSKMVKCDYKYRHLQAPYLLDCEHVLLHQCMRSASEAKLFHNPFMKLWYGHATLEQLEKAFRTVGRRIRDAFKSK